MHSFPPTEVKTGQPSNGLEWSVPNYAVICMYADMGQICDYFEFKYFSMLYWACLVYNLWNTLKKCKRANTLVLLSGSIAAGKINWAQKSIWIQKYLRYLTQVCKQVIALPFTHLLIQSLTHALARFNRGQKRPAQPWNGKFSLSVCWHLRVCRWFILTVLPFRFSPCQRTDLINRIPPDILPDPPGPAQTLLWLAEFELEQNVALRGGGSWFMSHQSVICTYSTHCCYSFLLLWMQHIFCVYLCRCPEIGFYFNLPAF